MLSKNHFDFIIIGNGLAGLQLALEFSKDTFFDNKQFALIDMSNKTKNDKTWCFWEEGSGKWDHIVFIDNISIVARSLNLVQRCLNYRLGKSTTTTLRYSTRKRFISYFSMIRTLFF